MKRTILLSLGVGIAAVLLFPCLSPVHGESPLHGSPECSRVTIDGKTFQGGRSDADDFAFLKRKFETCGLAPPGDFDGPGGGSSPHPIFSGAVSEVQLASTPPLPPLPPGLGPEHTLRLEYGSGPVDLVFGKMDRRGESIRNRLVAEGWKPDTPFGQPEAIRVLVKTSGKEKAIVCLDEAEGAFLLIREGGR